MVDGGVAFTTKRAFNRTNVELKCNIIQRELRSMGAFNRTNVELKS